MVVDASGQEAATGSTGGRCGSSVTTFSLSSRPGQDRQGAPVPATGGSTEASQRGRLLSRLLSGGATMRVAAALLNLKRGPFCALTGEYSVPFSLRDGALPRISGGLCLVSWQHATPPAACQQEVAGERGQAPLGASYICIVLPLRSQQQTQDSL